MKEGTVEMRKKLIAGLALLVLVFFAFSTFVESSAWARAGGRKLDREAAEAGAFLLRVRRRVHLRVLRASAHRAETHPSGTPGQPSGGFFSRSPFMQGLAGGLAGGMLGSLLFGGMGHASSGGTAGGGMGLLDLPLLGSCSSSPTGFSKSDVPSRRLSPANYDQAGYQDEGGYSPSKSPIGTLSKAAIPPFRRWSRAFGR